MKANKSLNIQSLPYNTDSATLFNRLAHLPGSVWLDSGKPNSALGRYDILSALPSNTTEIESPDQLKRMAQALENHHCQSDLPFTGGWIGYFAYHFNHKKMGLNPPSNAGRTAWFGWYNWAIIVDHELQITHLMFQHSCAQETQERILEILNQENTVKPTDYTCGRFVADESKEHYLASLHHIRQYLLQGDCYQVNYAQRFSASFSGCPFSAYLKLRQSVPSPFSAYLNTGDQHILSISPERFIEINQQHAIAQPIKGTIKRGSNPQEDQELRNSLANSTKNRAENVMIVDLLRNDFSQHCRINSVRVPQMFDVQSFANVHHLVSTIEGKLSADCNHIEFLTDCFPGGSITGAPKKRAMEIIDELESEARGPYCGCLGYFSTNQKTDFNITIRTLNIKQNAIYAWAGGGIVFDSAAEDEYQESLTKIMTFLRAIETPT